MKSYFIVIIAAISLIITSCGEDFLDSKNLYQKNDENYYKNASDVSEALAAIYACLPSHEGINNGTLVSMLISDDCFAGGGTNDIQASAFDAFENPNQDLLLPLWIDCYQGIFRSNMLIKRFANAEFDSDDQKGQMKGEAHFLRAFFYYKLAKFFGTCPLILDPAPVNVPKASADDIFALIASDLKIAIESMPSTSVKKISVENLGHATKWAAQGFMARIFLFYTGYYKKEEIQLAEGGSITRSQVINWVDNCVDESGHELVPDFRNLWPYSYSNVDYPYAANNGLSWIGEDGDNYETVFAIKYSPFGSHTTADGNKMSYCNQLVLYASMRGQEGLLPFGKGWGMGTVSPLLWNSFEDGDTRKKGSICFVDDPEEGIDGSNPDSKSAKYQENVWNLVHETRLWQKKHTSVMVEQEGKLTNMFNIMYTNGEYQLWNMGDEVQMRFSDILLMGAELGSSKAQTYFDMVRTRAGLSTKTISLENIKQERRHELAFEGIRYFDLLRWHDAEAVFKALNDSKVPVETDGLPTTYSTNFRAITGGFMPIPEREVLLSAGVLEQNPGW